MSVSASATQVASNPNLALWSLMLLTFSIGVGEFVILGLLPEVAGSLSVSIPTAGWLVTAYALGVAIGGPGLVLATLRVPRRGLLLTLGAVFVAATVLCAVAPGYWTLMVGRLLASLTHGTFVGAAVVVATSLVPPERAGRAVAIVIGGFTAATVIGVPIGTWIGQAFGWRTVFWAIAAVAGLGLAGAALLLGRDSSRSELPNVRRELATLLRGPVLAALAITAFGFGGMFAAYTYVAPFLLDMTGVAPATVPIMLLIFGIGAVCGTTLGGRLTDNAPELSLRLFLGTLAVVLVAFPIFGKGTILAGALLFLMGAAAFGATPGLQLRVVRAAEDAPYLSSTMNVSAFNIGNALGAFAGGVALQSSIGLAGASWVGAAMVVLAFAVLLCVRSNR
jgi:DHA1 family inner membrane transport protein